MPCIGFIEVLRRRQEQEEKERERQRLKVEAECLRRAKEIYDFLEKHDQEWKKRQQK